MVKLKDTNINKILKIIIIILNVISIILGCRLFQLMVSKEAPLWLWILNGITLGLSLLLGIIRIIFLNVKKSNKSIYYGHPVFRLFVGLFLFAIFGIFAFYQAEIDLKNEQERLAFHERFDKRGNISYVSINFEENDYCKIKHTENLDYLSILIANMEIKSCKNYDVNSKGSDQVLFSIEFTGYDCYYCYVFYKDSPWIYYHFSEGDIFPTTGLYSFEANSVTIEATYSYLVENHELFHKVEEELN